MIKTHALLSAAALLAGCLMLVLQTSSSAATTLAPAVQQKDPIPDTFTNLQVLPKNISKPDLVDIMKGFCKTFKVRCSYCHVATDDLSQADFPSDEKGTKKEARELLRGIMKADKPAAETK